MFIRSNKCLTSTLGEYLMDEVSNDSEIPEVAAPETTQQEVSTKTNQESRNDRNWREMRRQNDELKQRAKMQEDMLSQLLKSQQQVPSQPKEEEIKISDDDYVQGSQVKKLLSQNAESVKRAAREETQRVIYEQEQSRFMEKLKRQFSDYEDIVNPETLALLEETDPDLVNTIVELKDPYKIGLQSYKYISALGLSKQIPASRRVKEVEKKLEENAKTVQTPQAYDKRPMAAAFQFGDVDKKTLYKEMMHFASMSGGGY